MNYNKEIKQLADRMIESSDIDGNYTKEDLLNALRIVKPVLMSLAAKNSHSFGNNKEQARLTFRDIMFTYKSVLERLVGFELTEDTNGYGDLDAEEIH